MSSNNPQVNATPQLNVSQISDLLVRQNFQNLQNYFAAQNQLLNFNFFDQSLTKAVTKFPVAHGLGYVPQDIIVTKYVGSPVTFLHGQFDSTNVYLTTTGASRVRFFVGTYWNLQSGTPGASSDQTTYTP